MIHRWAEMTGPEVDALDRQRTVVLVACSPLEVHGPHLPTMADLREGEGLAHAAAALLAEKHPEISFIELPWVWMAADVLPHRGSIKFRPSTVAQVLAEMGESLARQGWKHVWVTSFHGGPRHVVALEEGCHRAHQATGIEMISVFSLLVSRLTGGSSDLGSLLGGLGGITRDELVGDAHGGLVETAMLLHLAGAHVDPRHRDLPPRSLELELAEAGKPPMHAGDKATLLELLRSFPMRHRYYERETYAGAPGKATAELGKLYVERLAQEAADALSERYMGTLPVSRCHSPLWPLRRIVLSERLGKLFETLVSTRHSPV